MNDSHAESASQAAPTSSADDRAAPALAGAGLLGTYLLVASLAMLFAASMVGYLVIRINHPPWPPPGFPELPRSLWLSTLVIVASSLAAQWALRDARRDAMAGLRRWLAATFLLGVVFLGLQVWAWWQIVAQIDAPSQNAGPYLKLFYVLTGLHAAHVIGGLIPLAAVLRGAWAGRYSAAFHPGVQYCAVYWHFLDAVWCTMFVIVYLI